MEQNKRFSKQLFAKEVWEKIYHLEKTYGFKSYDGWNQVKGKGEEINRAYGEYNCLFMLTNEYNLETR